MSSIALHLLYNPLISSNPHSSSFNSSASMAIENGKKVNVVSRVLSMQKTKLVGLLPVMLRVAALVATATATIVMGLNKQTKNTVVAMVGTTPIYQALTAKFQHTPAFVYFLIANAIASGYNLLVLLLRSFITTKSFDMLVHLIDMVMVPLVASGTAAAAAMADLGKHGNMHARWSPICNRFDTFCTRSGGALIASIVGAVLLLILSLLSTINSYKIASSQN